MPAGRPSTYTPEVIEQARAYITEFEQHGHAFPSVVGLTGVVGRSRETLMRWGREEDKPEWRDILDAINEQQELVALNRGIRGEYNAQIVKLLLGKHGYSDKVDNTLSAPGGGPVEWSLQPVKCADKD